MILFEKSSFMTSRSTIIAIVCTTPNVTIVGLNPFTIPINSYFYFAKIILLIIYKINPREVKKEKTITYLNAKPHPNLYFGDFSFQRASEWYHTKKLAKRISKQDKRYTYCNLRIQNQKGVKIGPWYPCVESQNRLSHKLSIKSRNLCPQNGHNPSNNKAKSIPPVFGSNESKWRI